MQTKAQKDINERAKVFSWFSIITYALTLFLPVVTYGLFFSFEAMIYDVLNGLGLALFFGGAVCSVVAVFSLKIPIRFKLSSVLSAGLSFFPLITIFSDVGYFSELNIGFYTYGIAAVSSLIAAIVYKNPDIEQPVSKQIPEQEPQVSQSNSQSQSPSQEQLREETGFCTSCGNKLYPSDNFCQQCGQNISGQK